MGSPWDHQPCFHGTTTRSLSFQGCHGIYILPRKHHGIKMARPWDKHEKSTGISSYRITMGSPRKSLGGTMGTPMLPWDHYGITTGLPCIHIMESPCLGGIATGQMWDEYRVCIPPWKHQGIITYCFCLSLFVSSPFEFDFDFGIDFLFHPLFVLFSRRY